MGVSEHYSLDTRTESWFEAILFPMHVFLCISNSKNPLFILLDTTQFVESAIPTISPLLALFCFEWGHLLRNVPFPKWSLFDLPLTTS